MKTNTVKKFGWFWAWQDEKEEAWLSDMAAKGYHLEEPRFIGVYHFQVGNPKNVVYRLDYNVLGKKDRESYLQLFQDAGWEHVGDMSSWAYFSKQVQAGEVLEIFSDTDSKIQKYQRIMTFLIILLPIFLFNINNFVPNKFGFPGNVILTIFTIILLLWAYALVKLMQRITQLKKNF